MWIFNRYFGLKEWALIIGIIAAPFVLYIVFTTNVVADSYNYLFTLSYEEKHMLVKKTDSEGKTYFVDAVDGDRVYDLVKAEEYNAGWFARHYRITEFLIVLWLAGAVAGGGTGLSSGLSALNLNYTKEGSYTGQMRTYINDPGSVLKSEGRSINFGPGMMFLMMYGLTILWWYTAVSSPRNAAIVGGIVDLTMKIIFGV